MPTIKTCEFCGKPLEPIEIPWKGQTLVVGYTPCTCSGALEAWATEQLQQANRDEVLLRARCLSAGIMPRYINAKPNAQVKEIVEAAIAGKNVYICGSVGTGKTTLASTAAAELIAKGYSLQFRSLAQLLFELRTDYTTDTLRECKACKVLVLDDFGKESPTGYALERLFDLIDHRNGHFKPTIVTSQLKPSQLAQRLAQAGNDVAVAIISRLRQDCKLIETSGVDMRLHNEEVDE